MIIQRYLHVVVLFYSLIQVVGCDRQSAGYVIASSSMSPLLKAGDTVQVRRVSDPQAWSPQRFAVIAFKYSESERIYFGRVIGLPGETLVSRDDGIYVDGRLLAMPDDLASLYRDRNKVIGGSETKYTIPSTHILVMQDNPGSRLQQAIPKQSVVGEVVAVNGQQVAVRPDQPPATQPAGVP